jgi:hypothetical protein
MRTLEVIFYLVILPYSGFSRYTTKYPDIPRIDVHAHVHNNYGGIANYLSMRTDIGSLAGKSAIPETVERYARTFRILETDQMVEGGFFSMNPVIGLNLPREVLERIYYRNALEIYPGLESRMKDLEY